MTVHTILLILTVIVAVRQRRRARLSEAELKRFRQYICTNDYVRLADGQRGIVTFVGSQVAIVRTESGNEVSVRKEVIHPISLN